MNNPQHQSNIFHQLLDWNSQQFFPNSHLQPTPRPATAAQTNKKTIYPLQDNQTINHDHLQLTEVINTIEKNRTSTGLQPRSS